MHTDTRGDKARLFRSLHSPARPLALANAWDVASARVVEAAGAPAVATTSAGVAWALGARDGSAVPRDRVVDLVARIAAAVAVPVTADIEDGYGAGPAEAAETALLIAEAGAVGVNIEDGTLPPAELAARLTAVRGAATGLFLNARIDTYLRGLGDPQHRLDETLERARRYADAGADGVFVPGVTDPATVRALAAGAPVPLNVMAGPGAPSVAELGALGAARVSLGSGVAQAAYAAARRATAELLGDGTYGTLTDAIPFPELDGLFTLRH
ncbi:isocitrate lyase/PEP mutase family protein [Streptomyces sp. NPDC004031]